METLTPPALSEEEYKGYPVESYLTRKGRTFWRSGKIVNYRGQPLGYETLEQLQSNIDGKIEFQEWEAKRPIIEGQIRQLLKEHPVWDRDELMTALNLEGEKGKQQFYRLLWVLGNEIYYT